MLMANSSTSKINEDTKTAYNSALKAALKERKVETGGMEPLAELALNGHLTKDYVSIKFFLSAIEKKHHEKIIGGLNSLFAKPTEKETLSFEEIYRLITHFSETGKKTLAVAISRGIQKKTDELEKQLPNINKFMDLAITQKAKTKLISEHNLLSGPLKNLRQTLPYQHMDDSISKSKSYKRTR